MELNYKKKLLLAYRLDDYNDYTGLKFTALEDGVKFTFSNSEKIKYRTEKDLNWDSVTAGDEFPSNGLKHNESIILCGDFIRVSSESEINGTFSSTGLFRVSGNIMSLIGQFDNNNSIDFTTNVSLVTRVFQNLFKDCENLYDANDLLLPATTLANYCYASMFRGCTSLITVPELPATTLANYCYQRMFQGCSSLTVSPVLPATILANYCYAYMFLGCSSLTTAPELPATTLKSGCYQRMFQGCSSLTASPVLPATTLKSGCYTYMFQQCTQLSHVVALFTNKDWETLATYTASWLDGVSPTGTFVKNRNSDWVVENITRDQSHVPSGWTIIGNYNPLSIDNRQEQSDIEISYKNNANNYELKYKIIDTDNLDIGDIDLINGFNIIGTSHILLEPGKSMILLGDATNVNFSKNNDIDIGNFCIESESESKDIHVSGSILSMIYGRNYNNYNNLPDQCKFRGLFKGTDITDASQLKLCTYNLNNCPQCYESMFQNCSSLTTAPELPATILAKYCYAYMFDGCSSLTTTPKLPATILADNCYEYMFQNCSSLMTIQDIYAKHYAGYSCQYMFGYCTNLTEATIDGYKGYIETSAHCFDNMFRECTNLMTIEFENLANPSTILSLQCCNYMFGDCTSLTTAIASRFSGNIAKGCYNGMFYNCTSLTTAPELPATILADNCYTYMFAECTSLTTAPELPATTLAPKCYSYMFSGCTSLKSLQSLPATDLYNGSLKRADNNEQGHYNCYERMFSGCTSLTTIGDVSNRIKLPATRLSSGCYKDMFNGCTSIISVDINALSVFTDVVGGEQKYSFGCYEGMFSYCGNLERIWFNDKSIVGGLIPGTTNDYYDTNNSQLYSAHYMGSQPNSFWCFGVKESSLCNFYKNADSKLGYTYMQAEGGGYFYIGGIPCSLHESDGNWKWTVNTI